VGGGNPQCKGGLSINELVIILLGGFALGVIHSLDPDHLAAMSTLVGRHRQDSWRASAKGLMWGVGHTLSLVSLGLLLVTLDGQVSGFWERGFEVGIGALLICLGIMRLRDAWRGLHFHVHRHGEVEHTHYHVHRIHVDHGTTEAHSRHTHAPLWIGILHGFAGTATVMALLPAVIIDQVGNYLLYVSTFGLASTLSMGAFCAGLGRLMARLQHASGNGGRWWAGSVGALSLGLGIVWFGNALSG
jgi:ABC-type nickel/cobalt efflux system permease component RcnA